MGVTGVGVGGRWAAGTLPLTQDIEGKEFVILRYLYCDLGSDELADKIRVGPRHVVGVVVGGGGGGIHTPT